MPAAMTGSAMPDPTLTRRPAFWWYLGLLARQKGRVVVGVLGSLLTALAALPVIPLLARVIDHSIPARSTGSLLRCIGGTTSTHPPSKLYSTPFAGSIQCPQC